MPMHLPQAEGLPLRFVPRNNRTDAREPMYSIASDGGVADGALGGERSQVARSGTEAASHQPGASHAHLGRRSSSTSIRQSLQFRIAVNQSQRYILIGIGGHLTMPPLPHHRAYGSVPRRFDRIRPQQGCRVWGGRASRNGGCVGPAGPPHVRPCASTPSASQRRWRLGPLRVPGGGAP